MWVAVAVAAVGAATAVYSSQEQKKAAKRAAGAQMDAATYAADIEKEMYDKGVELQQPFYQTGLAALPYLQSSILGGPVQSPDARYRQLSANDIELYNRQREQEASGGAPPSPVRLSDRLRMAVNTPNNAQGLLDIDGKYYMGPDGQIVDQVPQVLSNFDYKESPALKYQGVRLMRGLGARGLASGGIAPYAQAKLTAEDYDKQVGRLAGLVDIGRGTATNLSNLATGYGDKAAEIKLNLGESLAESELAKGRIRAGLYQSLGNSVTKGITGGMAAYGG